MPWTLYRYILKDLLKVLALSTGVLVLVIAVGAAIKPMSDGLLGPAGLVKFVLFSVPTMLDFAVPFAAAFAGTMVFCRMANDNEVLACRAGGMSYRAILLPVFCLGLVLTLILFYLSNWVTPIFYLKATRQIEQDMIKIMVSEIGKHRPVTFGSTVLYADAVDDTQPPPVVSGTDGKPAEVQPDSLIMLHGVAVARLDKRGQVRTESTAQQADALVYRRGNESWVTLQLLNFMVYDANSKDQGLAFVSHSSVLPLRLPNPFRDKLHFLSAPELKALGEHPERFDDVATKRQGLVDAMAEQKVLDLMGDALDATRGNGALTLDAPDGILTITAPQVERGGRDNHPMLRLSATPGAKVRADLSINGRLARHMEAASAEIALAVSDQDPEPQVVVTLRNVDISDPQLRGRLASRASLVLPRARWPGSVMTELAGQPALSLLKMADADTGASPIVVNARRQLDYSIGVLLRKIIARLHGRAASAVACLLVLMLGAVLSLLLRGSMPLVVYFWAFVLATVAVVIARSGENVASESVRLLHTGLFVIWSGNILLAAVVGGVFLRLRRH